ncbi:hypothetical protein SGFS_076470 [Streptomyces graminofaciens]|uniref:Uncharacterized protein n=1 Tax=Streptomyces graminofaciens TaxID=68212 RepID=A0ABM7FJ16_9ACTN|nr:hypothetical protein SGFS_076470 [Streptomyces graminofaciens]
MVLRATGPCSSTDRRTTLALVRRRSLSAARGTGDEKEGEGREGGEAEEEREREGEKEREGESAVAARGMAIILGNGSDTAPSREGSGAPEPPHPGRRQVAAPTRRRST